MPQHEKEINRWRTFAIISHPDAGKATLIEKFLLHGGAIAQAGQVKGRGNTRATASDWMEIKKQRGISVTSSVMQFQCEGYCINTLGAPSRQDFSEDTYRTLMAVDSAVMIIGATKDVGVQARKLFKVCAMRDVPIFTSINKMDREARGSFEPLEELERELSIETYLVNWPIDCGKDLGDVYGRNSWKIIHFTSNGGAKTATATGVELGDPNLDGLISKRLHRQLTDEIELLDGAVVKFNPDRVRHGKLSLASFDSALTNFGVEPLLEHFPQMTIASLPRWAGELVVDSLDDDFSAFMPRTQANVNKTHRDRIAFTRIVSGHFDVDKEVYRAQGSKELRLSRPQQLTAVGREIIEEAYAGDIIGVFGPGILSIGGILYAPGRKFRFDPIPTFAPEYLKWTRPLDTMEHKQFLKRMEQIAQKGAIQIFKTPHTGMEEVIVGTVGTLQFDVLEYRLRNEYNVELYMEGLPYEYLRWIETDDGEPAKEEDLILGTDVRPVEDCKGNQLLLFGSQRTINWMEEWDKNLTFHEFDGTRS